MEPLFNFLKGIIVGVGGIAPGLSGSVMLIVLGLYEKTINCLGNLFKNFKKNLFFLIPLVLGFAVGAVLFSKLVDFMLENHEFTTRYLFFGLVVGTVPLFHREVKKYGFNRKFYFLIAAAVICGFILLSFRKSGFVGEEASLIQSIWLGFAVAGSSVIPGIDSAAILSALGLYELYVRSMATFDFSILLPAGVGLVLGALFISSVMRYLMRKFYTVTFSVIFGLFLSVIPSILNSSCVLDTPEKIIKAALLSVSGFVISFYLENIKENNERIKKVLMCLSLKNRS